MPNVAWLYVGVLYAATVGLARRYGIDLPVRVAVFFYALTLAFLLGPLTAKQSNIHTDYLWTLSPWSTFRGDARVINPDMNDVPLQHAPWAHQVRRSWKKLTVPLWNAAAGCGYPLLANGQSSALSPIRLAALPLPLLRALAAEAAMKILIALTFTYLFCRGRGYSALASVAGAVTFGLSGFIAAWLHFPHVTAACFLPAVLFLVDRVAEGFTRARFVAAVAVWVSIILAGHPETAAHIFLLGLLYAAWIVAVERRGRWQLFLGLGGALTVAALLSAPFILPFLEALPRSHRYLSLQSTPYTRELPFAGPTELLAGFQPHFFGRVPSDQASRPAVTETVSAFAGMLGGVALFAVGFGVARRRAWRSAEAFFVVAAILAFGTFAGWPLLADAVHFALPVVAHARVRLLFVMLLAVLVAAALDAAGRGQGRELLAGACLAAAGLGAALAFVPLPGAAARQTALLAAVPAAMVIVLAMLFALRPRVTLQMAIVAAAVIDLALVTRGWNPSLPDYLYPDTPLITKLRELHSARSPEEPFRVAGMGGTLFPNVNALLGFEDVRVHDPMANGTYVRFLGVTAGLDPKSYHGTLERPDASVFDHLNVRYLVTHPGVIAWPSGDRWKPLYDAPDGRIFENQRFLPRFYGVRNALVDGDRASFAARLRAHRDWAATALLDGAAARDLPPELLAPAPAGSASADVRIVRASPTDYLLRVRAARPSLIVSSVAWWPGWKVERSGQSAKALRVDAAFIGFAVPAGEWDVRVRYSPWTFRLGWIVALVTAMGLAVKLASPRVAHAGSG